MKHRCRKLLLALLALAGLWTLGPAAVARAAPVPTKEPAREAPPPRILSMRRQYHSPADYQRLRGEWESWTRRHPDDATGWAELARAAMYTQAECKEFVGYAEKAVRLGPRNADALATLGRVKWAMYCPDQPSDPSQAMALLERALKLDPTLDDPHYILWTMLRSLGRREEADAHLRALLDAGEIPEPLMDFGYNLLVGLEPDAILLTNGDNDTYPLIALQSARGFRTDVSVVNVSLLNILWFRRDLRQGPNPVPVPLLEDDPNHSRGDEALEELFAEQDRTGWKRPIYAAVTVSCQSHPIPKTLSLEGVVYRVLPSAPRAPLDRAVMTRNLEKLYRIQSVTSPAVNWDDWSSLRFLMNNYAAADYQLATARAQSGDVPGARTLVIRALELIDFHHADPEFARGMIGAWERWEPRSPDPAKWKKKLGL